MNLGYLPVLLDLPLSIQRSVLCVLHLKSELVQHRQDRLKPLRSLLRLQRSYPRHQLYYKPVNSDQVILGINSIINLLLRSRSYLSDLLK